MMMTFARRPYALPIFVACLWASQPAHAEGAFAVGSTGNVIKDGIAYGGSYNYSTRDEAEAAALKSCRAFKGATRAAKFCWLVATFKKECYATANDPKSGTPGTGYAVAGDETTAKARALATCQATAGADRRNYCVVDASHCDEND